MKYSFDCCGHKNITAKHKTTLEFTKDKELSLKGDCIIGVNSDFSLASLKKFIDKSDNKKISITIKTINKKNPITERVNAQVNSIFRSGNEIVIRKTDFVSERTFAVKADKSAFDLNRDLVEFLKERKNKIKVIIKGY